MLQLKFKRIHLPTGTETIGTFTGAQVEGLDHAPWRSAERLCKEALDRWNRQQPGEWRYEYLGFSNEVDA